LNKEQREKEEKKSLLWPFLLGLLLCKANFPSFGNDKKKARGLSSWWVYTHTARQGMSPKGAILAFGK
jgi:hypothetical protein